MNGEVGDSNRAKDTSSWEGAVTGPGGRGSARAGRWGVEHGYEENSGCGGGSWEADEGDRGNQKHREKELVGRVSERVVGVSSCEWGGRRTTWRICWGGWLLASHDANQTRG
jgi:hypothetical protein